MSTVLSCVLVANRGEIARRVFATCRRAGYRSVAVFSDPDADAPHVAEADAAVRLPGSSPADTYLRGDLLIAAALSAGADAVHPGYGFLAENAEFALAVLAAGLTWIGPPVAAIESMGSKIEAKKLMADAGVPVLPELDPSAVGAADLPVLIKASAGGGGQGIRVVATLAELPAALAAAARQAQSAFGDPAVFCERYLPAGHHVEVQILADAHGTVWTVGERECSIQRRHQKVLEETPAPLVARIDGLRDRLFAAARSAATAVGYQGAGTVEFLADDHGEFFFLEMNTRLQVEHPVTECVTGLDLVAWQLEIAAGERLPPAPPRPRGHAIQARLYAEDPSRGWQPQSGTLHRLAITHRAFFEPFTTPGVRLDPGVADGSQVGVHYDPMLAKVIAYGESRAQAARLLAAALATAQVHGVTTNRDLLVRVLRHPAFLAGETTTDFLDTQDVFAPLADASTVELCAVAAALADAAANRAPALPEVLSGWRNLPSQPQQKVYRPTTAHATAAHGATTVHGATAAHGATAVRYRFSRAGVRVEGHPGVRVVAASAGTVVLEVDGVCRRFAVARYGGLVCVDSALGSVSLVRSPRFSEPAEQGEQVAAGSLVAPMPGTVSRLGAAVGDRVDAGQPLLWLEAMKMEHAIVAPTAGLVRDLPVGVGEMIDVGVVLAVIEPEERP